MFGLELGCSSEVDMVVVVRALVSVWVWRSILAAGAFRLLLEAEECWVFDLKGRLLRVWGQHLAEGVVGHCLMTLRRAEWRLLLAGQTCSCWWLLRWWALGSMCLWVLECERFGE